MNTTKPSNSCESSRKLTLDDYLALYLLQFGAETLQQVWGELMEGEEAFLLACAKEVFPDIYKRSRSSRTGMVLERLRMRHRQIQKRMQP